MTKKALYFRDSADRHYDRAYIDGLDVSKELCGYFFEVVLESGDLAINNAGTINVDYEDEINMLKNDEDKPVFKTPTNKQLKKVIEFAKKIGQRAEGFVVRRMASANRMFTIVNIVYDKNELKTNIINQNMSDKPDRFIKQNTALLTNKSKIVEILI